MVGLEAALLSTLLYRIEDLFHRLPVHWMWWPAIGAVFVGMGGLIDAHVLGAGYENIQALLDGSLAVRVVLALFVVKALVWLVALGSGTSGGVLAPLLILGGAAFFSAILAVLAVIPMTRGKNRHGHPNLLFFGTFSRMEEEAFIDEVTDRLRTEDSIYRTMARDVHQAGTVLQTKKYRMLTWAYRVFLLGLVASGVAFVIQYL